MQGIESNPNDISSNTSNLQERHDDSFGMGMNSPSLQDQANSGNQKVPTISDEKIGRNEKIKLKSPSGKEIEVKFKKLQHYVNQGYTKV